MNAIKIQQSRVITQQDARALFKAAKSGGQDAQAIKQQLVLKVASAQEQGALSVKEVKTASERTRVFIDRYSDGYTRVAEVRVVNPDSPHVIYDTILAKKIGPSSGQKTGYFVGWIGNLFLGLSSTLSSALLLADVYHTPQGVAVAVGAFVAGAYGVFKIGKNLVNSWKGRTNTRLQIIANTLEDSISAALRSVKEHPPVQQ